MSTSSPLPAPANKKYGWQPDPQHARWLRWWTGNAWADHYWRLPGGSIDISDTAIPRLGIVGESYYDAEWRRVAAHIEQDAQDTWETTATLVPEPHNRHSFSGLATRVTVDGETIGYIPESALDNLGPAIHALGRAGYTITVRASLWARRFGGDLACSGKIALDSEQAPSAALPALQHAQAPLPKRQGAGWRVWLITIAAVVLLALIPVAGPVLAWIAIIGGIIWGNHVARQAPRTSVPAPGTPAAALTAELPQSPWHEQ